MLLATLRGRAWTTAAFATTAVFAGLGLCLAPKSASAQALERTAVSGAVGLGVRGAGQVGDCCGPFQTSLEQSRAIWGGGGISRKVSARIAVDGEGTWGREPNYVAYFQGILGEAPVRGYRSDNQIDTLTVAGLIRLRSCYGARSAVDVVGGLGWARESRRSQVESIVFRPGPVALPGIATEIAAARHLMPLIGGIDLITSGTHYALSAQIRLHLLVGAHDPVRTDLELGRQVVRFGIAVRRRF